jgi:hypothetical protein
MLRRSVHGCKDPTRKTSPADLAKWLESSTGGLSSLDRLQAITTRQPVSRSLTLTERLAEASGPNHPRARVIDENGPLSVAGPEEGRSVPHSRCVAAQDRLGGHETGLRHSMAESWRDCYPWRERSRRVGSLGSSKRGRA